MSINVGLEVICKEATFGTMEVEKLSGKVLMEKRYETQMWVTFTSSMLCGKWAYKGYSKKKIVIAVRGQGEVTVTRGWGRKSSEKKGQSIKQHRPQRGQGSSRRHSTRVWKGQFQPQAQLVIRSKHFIQRSGGGLLTPGVDEKVRKELEVASTDCSKYLMVNEGQILKIRAKGIERNLNMYCFQFFLFLAHFVAFKFHKKWEY